MDVVESNRVRDIHKGGTLSPYMTNFWKKEKKEKKTPAMNQQQLSFSGFVGRERDFQLPQAAVGAQVPRTLSGVCSFRWPPVGSWRRIEQQNLKGKPRGWGLRNFS